MMVLFVLSCSEQSNSAVMKEEKKIANIIETPQQSGQNISNDAQAEYDFVVAEAAVGSYNNITFTVAGFEESEDENSPWETYLDIAKKEFVDIVNGTIFNLDNDTRIQVIRLEKESDEVKGKVYFKVLN